MSDIDSVRQGKHAKYIIDIVRLALDRCKTTDPDSPITAIIRDLFAEHLRQKLYDDSAIKELIRVALESVRTYEDKGSSDIEESTIFNKLTEPITPSDWRNKGIWFEEGGKIMNAIRCFDMAMAKDRKEIEAAYLKGCCLLRLGHVCSSMPKGFWYHFRHFRQMVEGALACFDQAIENNRQWGTAWHGKGVCLSEIAVGTSDLKIMERAIICLQKAIELEPNNNDARMELQSCRVFRAKEGN